MAALKFYSHCFKCSRSICGPHRSPKHQFEPGEFGVSCAARVNLMIMIFTLANLNIFYGFAFAIANVGSAAANCRSLACGMRHAACQLCHLAACLGHATLSTTCFACPTRRIRYKILLVQFSVAYCYRCCKCNITIAAGPLRLMVHSSIPVAPLP